MDFDEYDYLEKAVEDTDPHKSKDAANANGGDGAVRSGEKDSTRNSRKRDEGDDHLDAKSKRSRSSGDDSRDRHRDKREGERRDKDSDRRKSGSGRRDKDRDREERNGRDRDEVKDRDPEKGRERDRDRDRKDRNRDKDTERVRDERDRRSRSHSVRHRDDTEKTRETDNGERERIEREKNRDKEFSERSRDRELRDKDTRRHKEKKEDGTEPEADPERDQRTVFAYQLPLRADERDIFEFFSRVGKVRDVRLIMDRNSRRSKGVGYVEFYDSVSVPMAIALSGQPIRGVPIMVKPSEAEKNLVQSTATVAAGGLSASGAARRLYVGNLVPHITEEQLRVVFESFGTIELVQLPRDEAGLCKGFAFIQFSRLEDAKAALTLNGQLDIGGRLMKVSAVTDQPGFQDSGAATGDLDDDEGGGLSLNASSRALLMQKLDRSGTHSGLAIASPAVNSSGIAAASVTFPGAASGISPLVMPSLQTSLSSLGGLPGMGLSASSVSVPGIDTIGVPTECLVLTNMFDRSSETEPDFDLVIQEDVQDECTKFGKLKHIFVDKNSEGFVYLRFENTQSAMNAQTGLHGRWFAGKMITATYMLPLNYEAKFPESRE